MAVADQPSVPPVMALVTPEELTKPNEDDPETPHVGLFEQWHDIVDYLYQQGQWADEDLDEELEELEGE